MGYIILELLTIFSLLTFGQEKNYGECKAPGTWTSTTQLGLNGEYVLLTCDRAMNYSKMSADSFGNLINWYYSMHKEEFSNELILKYGEMSDRFRHGGTEALTKDDRRIVELLLAKAKTVLGSDVCNRLQRTQCLNKTSYYCISNLLERMGATEKPLSSSMTAMSSFGVLDAAGFENILESKKDLLSKLESIPDGALIIFDKAGGSCPIPEVGGTVALKCGTEIVWPKITPSGSKIVKQQLKPISQQYPDCIKAVFKGSRILTSDSERSIKSQLHPDPVRGVR